MSKSDEKHVHLSEEGTEKSIQKKKKLDSTVINIWIHSVNQGAYGT